jgi:hypothetical protein
MVKAEIDSCSVQTATAMGVGMIYVHETHEIVGGKMDEFAAAVRDVWRPRLEEHGGARLVWYWELTHGTGASYQAISLTAVRDWETWGDLVGRGIVRDWQREASALRKDVVAKVMLPAEWSPLQVVSLDDAWPLKEVESPTMYLHDTGWPFPGKLEPYVEALGRVLKPQEARTGMMSVAACFATAPGTGRQHEVLLLQRLDKWEPFARLLTEGEHNAPKGGWMEEGLKYRDRWESKLLRCACWSPRQ